MKIEDGGELYCYEARGEDGRTIYLGATTDRGDLDFYLKGHPSVHSLHVRTYKLKLTCGEVLTADRSPELLRTWESRRGNR